MITLTREQLINLIKLLASEYCDGSFIRLDVDDIKDYCEVWCRDDTLDTNLNQYCEMCGTLEEVFGELEERWLANK